MRDTRVYIYIYSRDSDVKSDNFPFNLPISKRNYGRRNRDTVPEPWATASGRSVITGKVGVLLAVPRRQESLEHVANNQRTGKPPRVRRRAPKANLRYVMYDNRWRSKNETKKVSKAIKVYYLRS